MKYMDFLDLEALFKHAAECMKMQRIPLDTGDPLC